MGRLPQQVIPAVLPQATTEQHLAPKTVRNIHALLHRALKDAARCKLPLPLLERGAIRSGGGYRQAGW